MKQSKTSIIATIGPASKNPKTLLQMAKRGMDIARLNMSWGTFPEHSQFIKDIRQSAKSAGKNVPILMDLPGPRVQYKEGHGYDKTFESAITERDKEIIKFGVEQKIEYFGISFVASKKDILEAKELIKKFGGSQKVVAKIERQIALDNLEEIVEEADGVMVARGDLGNEITLERIPFVEEEIINVCKEKNKFVTVATQMMLSMTEHDKPTRAEVTDVTYAILKKADAVMLSEETASGKFPIKTVAMMEKILLEAESHIKTEEENSNLPRNFFGSLFGSKTKKIRIKNLKALEILDSRGNPTLKIFCKSENGKIGVASVPSGASTGTHETCELRDEDKDRFSGKGVLKAKENVETEILANVKNILLDQKTLDQKMIDLDGTENKSNLGANAILGVSLAFADCLAKENGEELYEYVHSIYKNFRKKIIPTPMFNVINGGVHADSGLEIQEFMIVPVGLQNFSDKLRAGSEIFQMLKKILKEKGYNISVGDEGGFAPHLFDNEEALKILVEAIEKSGYNTKDVKISMDVAASEFYSKNFYNLKIAGENKKIHSQELLNWYENIVHKYPIFSIEDPFAEDDFEGFSMITKKLGKKIIIVGDDLTVTNIKRIKKAKEGKVINSVLIKLNQIGTLTETLAAISETQKNNWSPIISHRSGETSDTFIADLAVAVGAHFIKAGAPSRGERVCKYNRLLEIENNL